MFSNQVLYKTLMLRVCYSAQAKTILLKKNWVSSSPSAHSIKASQKQGSACTDCWNKRGYFRRVQGSWAH